MRHRKGEGNQQTEKGEDGAIDRRRPRLGGVTSFTANPPHAEAPSHHQQKQHADEQTE